MKKMVLRLSIKKTKFMTTDRTIILRNDNEDTEVMENFCISGSTINSKGTNSYQICHWLAQ